MASAVGEDTSVRGGLVRSAGTAALVVNARARIEPDMLRFIVERSAADAAGDGIEVSIGSLNSFSPAYPRSTHRFDSVIRE